MLGLLRPSGAQPKNNTLLNYKPVAPNGAMTCVGAEFLSIWY